MKVLFIVNHFVVIYNFRKELVKALADEGNSICISCPEDKRLSYFTDMGVSVDNAPINRHSKNPLTELKTFSYYKKLIKKFKPDIVLTYTVKPNIYAGYICGTHGVPYIANITGLGSSIEGKGVLSKVVLSLYKTGLKHAGCVFFQNKSNREFFLSKGIIKCDNYLIPGSGVNLTEHKYEEYPSEDNGFVILYIGRIMKEKGIIELCEAAKQIRAVYPNVTFRAIGFMEDEFRDELSHINDGSDLVMLGQKDNVHGYIKDCHAAILPSYHEGMANVLLEAAATGRPVLASDIPGCSETFIEGVSGMGFEPRNVDSLTDCIVRFLALGTEQRRQMGIEGRKYVEARFDRNIVIGKYEEEIGKRAKPYRP